MWYVQSPAFLRFTYSNSLQECQNLAYEALRNYIPHDAKAVDLQLAANTSSLVQWSVITPSAYNAVLARTTDSLDIHVSIHYD